MGRRRRVVGRGRARRPGARPQHVESRPRDLPDHASRAELLEAIGRGIGRTAAHELAHQLLPQAPLHDSTDVASYEYDSAARREQYVGAMHWAIARPWLQARLTH